MSAPRVIFGAKGGGKGGKKAKGGREAADTLRSIAYAQLLTLISEGDIGGLVDGDKSRFIDGTPLQAADGSYNFDGVTTWFRNGTEGQGYIEGFPAAEAETYLGVNVSANILQGAAISSLTRSGTLATLTTTAPHGRSSGDTVTIAGAVPGEFNGTFIITVTAPDAFTFIMVSAPTSDATAPGSWSYNSGGLVKTFTNANLDAVVVVASFPRLALIDGNGNILGATVNYRIDHRSNGGPWSTVHDVTISGKAGGKYQRSHRVPLTGSPPHDIRFTRITPDSASSKLDDKTYWESYKEVIDSKFRYPFSALAGIRIDAEQFSAIPTIAGDYYLRLIEVPTNYDPATRTYSGTWDGTFKVAWSDSPPWCFRDLCLNARYGLGDFIAADQIDKWTLYEIAKYCDELVPDGFGGFEPRYTCNVYLQQREQAHRVLADMASIMRAMVYWAGGQIRLSQDRPQAPVALFTDANIIGKFTRQGSPRSQRHTVALVAWNDPADMGRRKIEYVEDLDGIARYGIRQTEIYAFGCSSRGMAHRLGRALLYTERLESDLITWRVGLDGLLVEPGNVAQIVDSKRAGKRIGGRITAATSNSVTLDRAFTFDAGVTYTLTVVGFDGAPQIKTATNAPGAASVVTVDSAFDSTPAQHHVWVMSEPALEPESVRVLAVAEVEKSQIEFTASEYSPEKFAAIEQGLILEPSRVSGLTLAPPAPVNLRIDEYLYESGAEVRVGALFSWDMVTTAAGYYVSYKPSGGNIVDLGLISANTIEAGDVPPGPIIFSVQAVNGLNFRSPSASITQEIFGKILPPADVTGFGLTAISGTAALFNWDRHPDLDVRVDGEIVVCHSPLIGPGIGWNDCFEVARFSGAATTGAGPLLGGTYIARALDSSGNWSEGDAKIETTAPALIGLDVVETLTEHPSFSGTKTNLAVSDLGLQLTGLGMVDDMPEIDAVEDWDSFGGMAAEGEYLLSAPIDAGAVYAAMRITAAVETISFGIGNTIDTRPGLVDTWEDIDGAQSNATSAILYIATTNDDPAGAPTWSSWQTFIVGDYSGRAFKFKLLLASDAADQNIAIKSLAVTVDVPDRIEGAEDVTCPAGGMRVTFARAFFRRPAIAITAENMVTGDYADISGQDSTGFDVTFRNSAAAGVERRFDWMAKGFGEITP